MASAAGETTGGLGLLRRLFGERRSGAPAEPATTVADPIAEAAMLALHHQGIRPTPEAYTLWYRHLAGERPDLSRRLADLEARGEVFDAALIGELYERYFGAEPEVLQVTSASHEIERLLVDLAQDLVAVEAEAKARGERLDELGRALTKEDTAAATASGRTLQAPLQTKGGAAHGAAIRGLVVGILEQAAAMRAAALRLQRRAVENAGEVAQLRATLEAAGLGEARDPVTGVAAAKALQRALRRAAVAAESAPALPSAKAAAFCFAIVDLDAFRGFNERHGRRLGDLVLKTTARQLALALAPGDTIGRLDGAAFGIVLARTDLAGGEAAAERLCRLVAELRIEPDDPDIVKGFAVPPVTVAIGVATWHQGEPLKRLVGRADRARRLAKEAGGNRVVSERATAVVGRPKA